MSQQHEEPHWRLGIMTVYATSTRQKLNIRSSTEAELVAVNHIMPQNFLSTQGIDLKDNIVYQANKVVFFN
jgi:hypothetical protein